MSAAGSRRRSRRTSRRCSRAAPEPADALDLGSLGGAVLAKRLQDPRALGALLALTALVFYLLGARRRE